VVAIACVSVAVAVAVAFLLFGMAKRKKVSTPFGDVAMEATVSLHSLAFKGDGSQLEELLCAMYPNAQPLPTVGDMGTFEDIASDTEGDDSSVALLKQGAAARVLASSDFGAQHGLNPTVCRCDRQGQ
jgi:hypothetical protein